MWTHRVRGVILAMLLAAAGLSLGACEPRWGHVGAAFHKVF